MQVSRGFRRQAQSRCKVPDKPARTALEVRVIFKAERPARSLEGPLHLAFPAADLEGRVDSALLAAEAVPAPVGLAAGLR